VTEIFTDHHNAAVTTNDFALVANLLHAWFDLHLSPITCLLVYLFTYTDKQFDLG
jgi:hypothetical protein